MDEAESHRDEARRLFSRPWAFVTSAPSARHLPPAGPLEIAFAGRSNVGKSTLINALCFQKSLARTSNTPGRTQALNFFVPEPGQDDAGRLPTMAIVDMPGYGYAKAPKAMVEAWTKLVFDYLRGRPTLKRVFLLIDSRHGVKRNDEEVMELLDKAAVSYQIVLTKADKPGAEELSKRISATRQAISKRPAAHPQLLAVSAQKDRGLDDLREAIYSLTVEQNNG